MEQLIRFGELFKLTTMKNITSEIKEANEEFMTAFSSGDARALARIYTDSAKLYPTNSDVVEGREAIKDFWNAVMNAGIKRVLLETVIAENHENIAIEEGRYRLYTEEDQIVDQGKYIVTWENEEGKWKLHRDIWNTSNPVEAKRAETAKTSNIDLARKFNAYLDEQNFDGLRSISDPGLKIYYESGDPASLNDMEPFVKSYYQSFPDYTHEIEDVFAADDKAVARVAFSGTHINEFTGIKPTGEKFRYKGIQIYQFKDDKICNLWIVEDELSMMTQLGLELKSKEEMDYTA
jgi:uncharacterized protein (TIGR02246 family)